MPAIRAFSSYLPEGRLTNAELAARLGTTPEWILEVSGIEERRVAGSQSVVDLAVAAARACLARAGRASSEIGCVIVSSASAENRFPGPAAVVVKELGLAGIPAIDVPVASAGSLFALSLADQLVRRNGTVLVIASEKMSSHGTAEPLDKNVAILFGDGAGACLVTADETAAPGERCLKILSHAIHSDGTFAADLKLPWSGRVEMNGLAVILQASRKLPAVIQEVAGAASIPLSSVAVFLLHQANRNLLLKVAKTLSVDPARFFSNIESYGNTSSASMLIAAADWAAESTPVPGETVVFAAFGAGFHWGGLAARQVE
jgi:3-oxoacyl-[acyl-carrier-protein] synthase III